MAFFPMCAAYYHGLFTHILERTHFLLLAQETEAEELQKLPSKHNYTE